MSNQVQVVNQAAMPAVSAETSALLSMIERVCLDPSADIDKLSKMLDMQERVLNRNAEQAFAADFAAMQSELPRIARNGVITMKDKSTGKVIQSTPFAKLEDINDGVRPTLQKYGFGVSFTIDQAGGLITVTAKLLHRLGHSEKTSISLPIDTSGSKNNVQGNGSTVSYGKRYAICALLNISTGDDTDGNLPPEIKTEITKTAIKDEILTYAIGEIQGRRAPLSKLLDNHTFTESQKVTIKAAFPQVQL
jgi:hypothetical protein